MRFQHIHGNLKIFKRDYKVLKNRGVQNVKGYVKILIYMNINFTHKKLA